MVTRQSVCYNVLKKHGVLITYSGKSLGKVNSLKKIGETFAQWKLRVLGPNVKDVLVYSPYAPAPQTHMATLEESSGGSHVHKIFEAFGRRKDKLRDKEIEEATEEAYELFASIPKETVQDIADSFGATLQPSLKELLDGFLNTTAEDIDTSEFLRALLEKYNETVRLYRESQG